MIDSLKSRKLMTLHPLEWICNGSELFYCVLHNVSLT